MTAAKQSKKPAAPERFRAAEFAGHVYHGLSLLDLISEDWQVLAQYYLQKVTTTVKDLNAYLGPLEKAHREEDGEAVAQARAGLNALDRLLDRAIEAFEARHGVDAL